jgi:hypothetical protein
MSSVESKMFVWRGGLALVLAAMMGVTVVGCGDRPRMARQEVRFEVEPSRQAVLVGENVTVTTRTQNILGQEADVEWNTSGGELFTEQNRRVARVYFDEPGTYMVQANLFLNGRLTRTATTTITVQDLPRPR